jgi:protein tyrosine phosphatase
MLKDEITNIAMRIVKAREAKTNMTFSEETGTLQGTWKVGEVELMNKGFNEANRYYNVFPYQRNHGLKFVSPPVGSETFQQLKAE